MSRLFISHSSKNDDWAIALRDWMMREGWSAEDDIFLDLDPERGIVAGQHWAQSLEDAASRCEAVLFLISEDWLTSKWCYDEYQLANKLNKKLFALLIDEISLDRLPNGLTAQWQVVHLKGEPAERFLTIHPITLRQSPIHIARAGLTSLKRGLQKAGIRPETFELLPDPSEAPGWRAPYRGLEAFEPEDAAVFFGRSADIVRGIDALRGLASRKQPRLMVVLGASGAGKSSFLRAGLWARLLRDDSQWLPLKVIRAGRGGAIEGNEGLLAALQEIHRRFALPTSRADLRECLATPETFTAHLRELRQAGARRTLLREPPFPLPVLCLDQGEEFFAANAGPESEKLLRLARAAIDVDAALLLVTIRSDSYGLMQSAPALVGIDQVPLSLGPVPHGEIARIIREPAEILRRKAGPSAPIFDAPVVERLQEEVAGETDALPLLAFVLQRLMHEHQGRVAAIGLDELQRTGGVAAALESEADAALADAGYGTDQALQREVLRRLFIPRLVRIDRKSKLPQRHVARQSELPTDLLPLVHALTQRRLLVVKLVAGDGTDTEASGATVEVAHEALLRRWPTLADILAEDRDTLLLLDGVILAAADWDRAGAARKSDFLTHRGSRLFDAQALAARGTDWEHAITPARAYLSACEAREVLDRVEAQKQRDRAERALSAATDTANALVFDLAQGLRDAGLPIAVGKTILDRVRKLQDELIAAGNIAPNLMRSQAMTLGATSDNLLILGDAAGAIEAAQTAREKFLSLLADAPNDIGLALSLANCDDRIGDILLQQGKSDDALASYSKSRDIRRMAASGIPPDPGRQGLLAVSALKVGDALFEQENYQLALATYQEGVAIARMLVAHDANAPEPRRYVAAFATRIGNAFDKLRKTDDALVVYREALACMSELVTKAGDGNTQWQRDLSVTHRKIARILRDQGHLGDALGACEQGIAIALALARKDAENAEWQYDLWDSYGLLGDILRDQVKLGDALDAYHRALAIIQALAAKSGGDQHRSADLRRTIDKLATLSYRMILRQQAFDSALSVVDEAIALAPKSIWMYANRAHALMFLGRNEEARAIYLQYRGQRVSPSHSWEAAIQEDFGSFAGIGLYRPLMDEIKTAFAPTP